MSACTWAGADLCLHARTLMGVLCEKNWMLILLHFASLWFQLGQTILAMEGVL